PLPASGHPPPYRRKTTCKPKVLVADVGEGRGGGQLTKSTSLGSFETGMDMVDSDDWLNLGEAAEKLGVHPSTLRAWADRGEIASHRTAGNHRRFRRSDIEAWAASRREAHPSAGQLIVESALGRTRLQMAEGRLTHTAWYSHFDETRKQELREPGRRLLSLLMRYLSEEGEAVLEDAKEIGREYERLGRQSGLPLSETVSVFLYFRDFLY